MIARLGEGKTKTVIQMWNTWNIREDERRDRIVTWVATVARNSPIKKLRHLVLNCHGSSGHVSLGHGFYKSELSLLTAWRGLLDNIWIVACEVADGERGDSFCRRMAEITDAFVIASSATQCNQVTVYPQDWLPPFEGRIYTFEPGGATSMAIQPSAYDPTLRRDNCIANTYSIRGGRPRYR